MYGALSSLPAAAFAPHPTPVEELARLTDALPSPPRLFVKRDDTIGFAFGGNKVRKLRLVAADAAARGADTLITAGGVQSNHARATAAAAAALGMRALLVHNGAPPGRATGNRLLGDILGADPHYVASREERAPAMERLAAEVRARGGCPYVIPIGASNPLGAAAFVAAVAELLEQMDPPDVIVHATSSGGTQAGLVAGCTLAGVPTRVLGISADEPAAALESTIRAILTGLGSLLDVGASRFDDVRVEVDDTFVGGGYGVATEASTEALTLLARREGLFLDPTYTAKAMAGLLAYVRRGRFAPSARILFWHTGGQAGLFA